MAAVAVEVLDASDLMPKDGQGSANPYVEVQIDDQKQRTQTKFKDLYPQWNQKLFFQLDDSRDLSHRVIDVSVYNEKKDGHHNNFLGRVKISGATVPLSESEAAEQRYPLDKRGMFSHIKGDIALKVYAVPGKFPPAGANNTHSEFSQAETQARNIHFSQEDNQQKRTHEEGQGNRTHFGFPHEAQFGFSPEDTQGSRNREPPLQEINNHHHHKEKNSNHFRNDSETMKPKKEKEVRTFYSIGTGGVPPMAASKPVEFRADFAKSGPGPGSVMHMQAPPPGIRPEFGLVETRPPLAARARYWSGDKTSSTYDLVEKMYFLYVSVVKARDLPVMDITGSLDPYVEVKLGNYRGVTRHVEKNQNPVWEKVFAFSKENLQSSVIEVVVKDKDLVTKDDFVGRLVFDIAEVPLRLPPDSPLAPQWYRLEDRRGIKTHGELMLAVWMGTQADESFPDAWHSDAHDVSQHNLANTRSKVYFSPKLYYLRVQVIGAQDLVPSNHSHAPDTFVKVQLGHQIRVTRTSPMRHLNPEWNEEELMFVASEPFEELMIVSVEDKVSSELLGRLLVSVRDIPQRGEVTKLPDARWFNLHKPHSGMGDEKDNDKKKEVRFSSKIHLRLWLDVGYHVLDESTHFSSDLQPSAKSLRKPNIGILEVGILSARNLHPLKSGGTTDAYCVAKYGNKWIRTRTLINTLAPRWNEQYTWDVFDPCTVITIGVFDNWHINNGSDTKDVRIGKVRIRLSTLETNKVYTHFYPLLVLTPSGLKKHGELHLAVRFTCTGWANMVVQYGKPLLPKMHYVQPIPLRHIDWLRHQAMQIVAARLSRAEPPLRKEAVEYMLDVDYHMWSLRRSKANFYRIMSLLSGVSAVCKWFNDVCNWRNPITTILVHVLFLILVCYPELILPTIFLYLFVIGLWNYRFRPRQPPHMDARISQAERVHPDELDEEFDSFPTSRPPDLVRMRYDRLRSVSGRIQSVIGDLATQGERALAILSWRDPRGTAIFIIIALISAVFLYVTPFQVIAVIFGLYWLRHPRLRSKLPSVPVNFFKRLPAKSDMLL